MSGKVYIVKIKKSQAVDTCKIPFHPEVVFVTKISKSQWLAKDDSGHVKVTKKEKGEFVEYFVEDTTS
ncbi:MAG TPA: hypothetical protein VEW42_01795 [Candidatus Eisenbacteria bacterium]|nr:hypothetical protein [Candidatus Eisenbacteria bacterium]